MTEYFSEPSLSCIGFAALFFYCRIASAAMPTVLSYKFSIPIKNTFLAKFLISSHNHSGQKNTGDVRKRMGLWGLIGYIAFIPAGLSIWARYGTFWLFHVELFLGSKEVAIYLIAMICHMVGFSLDIRIKLSMDDMAEDRAPNRKEVAGRLEAIDFDAIPMELRERAKQILDKPDKIICDYDQQEYYYICGKDLLRFHFDGTFVSLTPEADSRRVLTAMRTGRITTK